MTRGAFLVASVQIPMPTWLLIVLVLVVLLAVIPGAAVILAGVIAMFFAPADYDRRRRQLAEGLCVHCGYDLHGMAGATGDGGLCPECGKPPFASPDANRVKSDK